MVDCNKGTRDCATQQPTKYLCPIKEASNNRGTTTLSMQWSCPTSSRKRLQRRQWQLIVTSTWDCASDEQPFNWCGPIVNVAWSASDKIDRDATTTTRGLSQYIFNYWRNMKRYCNVLVLLCRSSILQYLLRLHIAIRYISISFLCSILQYIATYCYLNHEIHTYIAASY